MSRLEQIAIATWRGRQYTVHVIRVTEGHKSPLPSPVGMYLQQRTGSSTIKFVGFFMDFHDKDIEAEGYSKTRYDILSLSKRAEVNAKIQAEKYGDSNWR